MKKGRISEFEYIPFGADMEKNKGFSSTIGGLVLMVAGTYLGTQFSEDCTTEIMAKLTPVLAMIPGLIVAWIGRFKKGDITPLGFRK